MKTNKNLVLLLSIVLIVGLMAGVVVQNFSSPLTNTLGGDTDFWEYMGYYFYRNLKFFDANHFFYPYIQFVSNQHLYPYGTTHVFQGWAVESCLWYAAAYKLIDPWGNWLGYYYVLGAVITFVGSYWLLRRPIGWQRAVIVGLLVTLFNFYSLHRYPEHFSHTVHHWVTLNLIFDYVLFRSFLEQKIISLRQILSKGILLVLSLGLEVGYVSGYALASFVLLLLASLLIYGLRVRQKGLLTISDTLSELLTTYRKEWQSARWEIIILGSLLFAISWLYVGIMLQIVLEVSKFPANEQQGTWWINPFRLLLPFYKVVGPTDLQALFKDLPEGYAQGMIGWFLLGLGIWGFLRSSARQRLTLMPLLVLMVLCLFYHPTRIPTLQIFPWFTYNRVPGRATIIYPTIITLVAIEALFLPRQSVSKALYLLLILIGIGEFYVNYSYKWQQKPSRLAASVKPYMEVVAKHRGEAVLDYPFCIIGGNGVGRQEGLAGLYGSNANVSTMQRFHQKKTIGHYYGRLTKQQIAPQVAHGWGNLMTPQTDNPYEKQRLKDCLNNQQFKDLINFVQYNDFAGINLYVDLLPNVACRQSFFEFFGHFLASTNIPGSGSVVFIPKPEAWHRMASENKGKSIYFAP